MDGKSLNQGGELETLQNKIKRVFANNRYLESEETDYSLDRLTILAVQSVQFVNGTSDEQIEDTVSRVKQGLGANPNCWQQFVIWVKSMVFRGRIEEAAKTAFLELKRYDKQVGCTVLDSATPRASNNDQKMIGLAVKALRDAAQSYQTD